MPDILNKDKNKESQSSTKKVDLNMSVPLADKPRDNTIKSQPAKIGNRTMSNDYNATSNVRQTGTSPGPMSDLISSNHHKIETRYYIAHLID